MAGGRELLWMEERQGEGCSGVKKQVGWPGEDGGTARTVDLVKPGGGSVAVPGQGVGTAYGRSLGWDGESLAAAGWFGWCCDTGHCTWLC